MAETFIVSNGKSVITKDPDAVLDYTFDWTSWLEVGETISSHSVAATGGAGSSAAVDSTIPQSKFVTAWVSGGVVGETVTLRCRITTSAGRTDDRSVYLKIKER